MRVERLTIKDFRGIPDLVLEFAGPVTVLAGVNGSGKTSVLDALAALLRRYGNAIRGGVRDRQPLQARDVRNGVSEAMLAMQVSLPPEHLRLAGDGPGHVGTRVERTLSRVRHHWVAAHAQLVATWLRDCLQEDPATSVPFAVLYRTNRAVLDIPLRIRKKHAFDQFSAYDDALEGGWSSFRLFFEWFREREDLENQERARSRRRLDPQLQAVRRAIEALMPGFSELRVQRAPLRMTVVKDGAELDLAQLSDGEKCLLAMTADIARRLALANPAERDPLRSAAVVLIDEIELHLHPRWQREVVPALVRTFPKCQFIVTTHSPQVLGSVRPEGVWLLDRKGATVVPVRPEASYGRHSNEILVELMGTPERPKQIRARLDQLFAKIDAGDFEAARRLRAELASEIGDDEPEFVRADVLMRLRRNGH